VRAVGALHRQRTAVCPPGCRQCAAVCPPACRLPSRACWAGVSCSWQPQSRASQPQPAQPHEQGGPLTRSNIITYYEYILNRSQSLAESSVMQELPPRLRIQLSLVHNKQFLTKAS